MPNHKQIATNKLNHIEHTALVVGASGGIAHALIQHLCSQNNVTDIIAISRSSCPVIFSAEGKLKWIVYESTEESIQACCQAIASDTEQITLTYICSGVLHTNELNNAIFPERRLQDFNQNTMQYIFNVNAFLPMLWLKHLMLLIKGKNPSRVIILSARVASIADNHLGGWYAYRASKAALNMFVKTAAIEYARSIKNAKFILFHPGTTDTQLSKPFQKNVLPEKLFTAQFVATRLYGASTQQYADNQLIFIDWDNNPIEW